MRLLGIICAFATIFCCVISLGGIGDRNAQLWCKFLTTPLMLLCLFAYMIYFINSNKIKLLDIVFVVCSFTLAVLLNLLRG